MLCQVTRAVFQEAKYLPQYVLFDSLNQYVWHGRTTSGVSTTVNVSISESRARKRHHSDPTASENMQAFKNIDMASNINTGLIRIPEIEDIIDL